MALTWLSADLLTGRVLAYLPGLVPKYPLRRTLGRYDTATATLLIDKHTPSNWERAVLEGGSVLACYDNTDPAETIQWGGIVWRQTRNTDDNTVELDLATAESYLARRDVRDATFIQIGQNTIASSLVTSFVADTGGMPLQVRVVTPGAGTLRDRTYKTTDHAKVYQRLQELMGVQGGPEWTIEWGWTADREHILPTLLVGDRIGRSPNPGLLPAAPFAMPGAVITAQHVRDYSDGKGATHVTAYSSGQGRTAPTSGPIAAASTGGRPRIDHAYSPSTSITATATLVEYATRAVARLAPGSNALTLTANLAKAPRLGQDWSLGDDIYYSIGGLDTAGRETVLTIPGGLTGVGRAIAVEIGADTITPILAQSSIYGEP